MARTKTTGDAPPPFIPTARGGDDHKILRGEGGADRKQEDKSSSPADWRGIPCGKATSFYTGAGKLDAEAAHISATGRATHLADHAMASGMLPSFIDDLMMSYREYLGDPSKWTIKLFHDPTGAVIANTASTANPQVLKPMGDIDNNTANTNRRAANIACVSLSIQVDFSQ